MNWFAGKKQRHRGREQTYGHQVWEAMGWWWWDELGDWDYPVYMYMHKIHN